MMKIQKTVKGTAATLTLGLGFEPDEVEVTNLTDRTGLLWLRRAGISATNAERFGLTIAAAGTRAATASAAYGVSLYAGGDKMTAASTVYVVLNEADQRAAYDANAPISGWTLGSSANKTGNFDVEASTDYVGPGSFVTIGGVMYEITAMTSNGESANEVTLDGAAPTGVVNRITSRYDFTGAAKGVIVPKGITIGASATVNDTDGDLLLVTATQY